jgi:hypothetical protein
MADIQGEFHGSEDEDATGEDLSEESFAGRESTTGFSMADAAVTLPHSEDRRSTFTFTIDAPTVDDLPDYESLNGLEDNETNEAEDDVPAEDATIVRLFRSPEKGVTHPVEFSEEIKYPELPHSDQDEVELDINPDPIATAEPTLSLPTDDDMLDVEELDIEIEESKEMVRERKVLVEEADNTDLNTQDLHITAEPIVESHVLEAAGPGTPTPPSDIEYPALPIQSSPRESNGSGPVSPLEPAIVLADEDAEMSEVLNQTMDQSEHGDSDAEDDVVLNAREEPTADEEFTEASLQLNILRDYQEATEVGQSVLEQPTEENAEPKALQDEQAEDVADPMDEDDYTNQLQEASEELPVKAPLADITDGLTLSFTPAKVQSAAPTPRKLQSPPPPQVQSDLDDATMTIALDDDTAILKGFLNRVAASKAEKAAVMTHRRESLKNRRDSDVIRHALASPRKILEDKDPNSPSKYDNELTLDLSQTLTLSMPDNDLVSPSADSAEREDPAGEESTRGSRRSSRAKKSRLPAPASAAPAQASKIAIRRPDGTEHVVLKKSDAQELSLITRNNTRKNKQGAFGVTVRLMKLAVDAANLPPLDDSTRELVVGKNIRWDEQLAYYQENPETVAEAESLATPDELGMSDASSTPSSKPKPKVSKTSTPKIRRVRGLGSTNGTPGKVLLAPSSFLPEITPVGAEKEKRQEKETAQQQQLPRPKPSKITRKSAIPPPTTTPSALPLPPLDIIPVGIEPARKSRLAAPKKVVLPQAVPVEGKENTTQRSGTGSGISGATPKKGIPAPKVVVPASVGMESGLPRRRGRKI